MTWRGLTTRVATGAAWLLLAVAFVFPFYWMLNLSLKGPEAMEEDPPRFLPLRDETVRVPRRELPVLQVPIAGKPTEVLGLSVTPGWVAFRIIRDGEVTQDTRRWSPGRFRSLNRTRAFGGHAAPVMIAPSGERAVVMGVHEMRVRGTDGTIRTSGTVYWIPEADLHGTWRVEASSARGFRPARKLRPRWRNYTEALTRLPFLLFFRNSFFVCIMATLGQLISASMAAYAFARLQFRGRDFWFVVLLATMMIPAEVTLIPMFLGYKTIGWVDSFLPLIVPQFCAGAFNVFLLRQFFLTIPRELDEAAAMDGASHFTVYWRVILPLSKPALIVVGVFTFVWFWKDLMGPLIYLDSMDKRTVALGLEYFRNPHEPNSHLMMAAAAVAMAPVAILFLVSQRYILKGIALTGIKR